MNFLTNSKLNSMSSFQYSSLNIALLHINLPIIKKYENINIDFIYKFNVLCCLHYRVTKDLLILHFCQFFHIFMFNSNKKWLLKHKRC